MTWEKEKEFALKLIAECLEECDNHDVPYYGTLSGLDYIADIVGHVNEPFPFKGGDGIVYKNSVGKILCMEDLGGMVNHGGYSGTRKHPYKAVLFVMHQLIRLREKIEEYDADESNQVV